MGSSNDPALDAGVALVFDWLRANRKFEIEAAESEAEAELLDDDAAFDSALDTAYAALQARFMSPRVIARKIPPAWGEPPCSTPDATTLVSATRRGGTITVLTLEPSQEPSLPPSEVRYRIVETELGPRIDRRHLRWPGDPWLEVDT